MPKPRVYELAQEYGMTSRALLRVLSDLGVFTRSASSTLEVPTVRLLQAKLARRPSVARGVAPRATRSGDRRPVMPRRNHPRLSGIGPTPQLSLVEEAAALRPRRRSPASAEADRRLRWAERLFEPAEISTWQAAGLGPADEGLAEQCRDAGLTPEDLGRVVDGLRVVLWLISGESVAVVRSRLRDQRNRAVG